MGEEVLVTMEQKRFKYSVTFFALVFTRKIWFGTGMMWDGEGQPFLGEIKQVRDLKEAECSEYQGVGLGRIYLKVLEKLVIVIVDQYMDKAF